MALSTTHVATGSILGTGLGRRGAEVRWGIAGRMAIAWVITLPAAGLVGAGCWFVADGVGGALGVGVVLAFLIAASGWMYVHSRKTAVDHHNVNDAWVDGVLEAVKETFHEDVPAVVLSDDPALVEPSYADPRLH